METQIGGISKLALTNFRCYQSLRLSDLSQNIIVYGQNGAGKTSILEAISMLSASKGLRGADYSEVKCLDTLSDQWGVAALLDMRNDQVSIGVGNLPGTALDQKAAKINGNSANIGDIERYLWLLWLTPQIDKIFVEPLSIKRKFFDHLVNGLEPEYRTKRLMYKKLINERMKALQSSICDKTWLDAIEYKIAEASFKVTASRSSYCKAFNETSVERHFPKITLFVEEDIPTENYQEVLLKKLKESRNKDRITGITSVGSHRNNWSVNFKNKPLRAESCSTGEQKIMLISVILTTSRIYIDRRIGVPILLFDDTTAHFDSENFQLFFEEISSMGIQTWSTSVNKPSALTGFQSIFVRSGVCIQE
ncbi:MAG: AAA family ATPase [Holosporales bacterium]|nr:AAA family ATPase [Holosporales bacterium]